MTGDMFNPDKYSGWPTALRNIATGIEKGLMPTGGNASELRRAADVLHLALAEVLALQRALVPLPPAPPTPGTRSKARKVREAMWEVWEDRMVDIKRERDNYAGRVKELQRAATKEVQRRREVEQEVRDLKKLACGLERVLKDLVAEAQPDDNVPRCDVPDLGRVAAQLEEVQGAATEAR